MSQDSTSEKLMDQLINALPYRREEILADVARIYGEGFARAVREQLRAKALDRVLRG